MYSLVHLGLKRQAQRPRFITHPPRLLAILEDQLASALPAELAHPCDPCDQALSAAQPLEELHAPSPVTAPVTAHPEARRGPLTPSQPQADPSVSQSKTYAVWGGGLNTVSSDVNSRTLPHGAAPDAASVAAADAQLLAAVAAAAAAE